MLNKVIFAIDNNTDLHTVSKFLSHVDKLVAMGKVKGPFVQCIGSYNGELETSYMADERDFINFIKHSGYVDNQESVLYIPGDVRQPCILVFTNGSNTLSLGAMEQIPAIEAMACHSWTYVIETGSYFTTK